LLEAVRRPLVDVGMVLAGEPPVRRLDGLVVGGLGHPEGLVVVLVFHARSKAAPGTLQSPRRFPRSSVADAWRFCGTAGEVRQRIGPANMARRSSRRTGSRPQLREVT